MNPTITVREGRLSQARLVRSSFAATVVGGLLLMFAMADALAAEHNWIVDETTDCGTSNPFPAADEYIRWYGPCVDGRLHGEGTLIWYGGDLEVERNKGSFLYGELHGKAVTRYPDGQTISGTYLNGQRNGDFLITRKDGDKISAVYERGRLMSQTNLTQRARTTPLAPVAAQPVQALAPSAPPASQAQPAVQPAPVAIAYPTNQVQTGFIQPAVLLRYDDNVDAGQLFRNLFASSGRNAVPPPPVETRVDYRAIAAQTGQAPAVMPASTVSPNNDAPSLATMDTYAAYGMLPQNYVPPPVITPPQGWAPTQPTLYGSRSPQPADSLVAQGYRFEQAGRFYEAEQTYQQVMLTHPSTPSALHASARLNALKQDQRRIPVRIDPRYTVPYSSPTSVIAVNSPVLNQTVCSRDGLYEDDVGWCGVVTRDESEHYHVEVREIRLRQFGTIGIARSTCTGNTFLTWFSRGATIRVPKPCVSFIR